MFQSQLMKEGENFQQKMKTKALKESAIMENIKSVNALKFDGGVIELSKVNENNKALTDLLNTFNASFSTEIKSIVEATKFKFNTNYSILLGGNVGNNALGEAVVFENSRPEFFQIVTNDLDCIATIISESMEKRMTSLISVDRIVDASSAGFDKSTTKTDEALSFMFEV